MKVILKQEELGEFRHMGQNGKSVFEALTDIMKFSIVRETFEMSGEIDIGIKNIDDEIITVEPK